MTNIALENPLEMEVLMILMILMNVYPLVNQHSYWKWRFIIDFPIENGGSFHSYVKVYQRVALENPLEMEVLMILMGT